MKALIDPRSGRVCELRQEGFAVADPLFWLDVSDEVTTRYSYNGANLLPPEAPALEEVRGLAIERSSTGRRSSCRRPWARSCRRLAPVPGALR